MAASHDFRGITEYLAWDHDAQEDALIEARDAVDQASFPAGLEAFERYQVRLLRHMRLEEKVLFPLVLALTPKLAHAVEEMRLEHRHVERDLARARAALVAGDADAFRAGFDALGLVLLAHEAREERLVYPVLDRSLSPEQRSDLAARLAREP